LVEKTPGPEKGYEGQRFVFLNATEVGKFFRDEALSMEGLAEPTLSPVLDYPSPKMDATNYRPY
jgi:hypothetical protein